MNNFLALLYKGEVKHLSEAEISEVNQVCLLLGVDISAVQLNKAKPKDSPSRKKNRPLGKSAAEVVIEDPIENFEKKNDKPECIPTPTTTAKSVKRTRVQEPKAPAVKKKQKDVTLYCLCREPERPGMIGCDFCDEWYHISCLNLKKEDAKQLTKCKWECPKCELANKKSTKGINQGIYLIIRILRNLVLRSS